MIYTIVAIVFVFAFFMGFSFGRLSGRVEGMVRFMTVLKLFIHRKRLSYPDLEKDLNAFIQDMKERNRSSRDHI